MCLIGGYYMYLYVLRSLVAYSIRNIEHKIHTMITTENIIILYS